MSQMSELDLCVGELRSAAQSLTAVADGLAALFTNGAQSSSYVFTQHGKDNKQIVVGKDSELSIFVADAPKPKPITLEQVRAVLADKSRSGHTAEVRELLQKHGASKLSEIDPGKYAALLADAEVLGNG